MNSAKILTYGSLAALAVFVVGAPESIKSQSAQSISYAISPYDSNLDKDVAALKAAIISGESGGDPNAINRHSRALGLGQVMPANIAAWSKAALGKTITEQEFLASPDYQHRIINHKLSEYWRTARATTNSKKEAARCVAAMWYSGRCSLKDSYAAQYYNGHSYPSIGSYADLAYQKYKSFGGRD